MAFLKLEVEGLFVRTGEGASVEDFNVGGGLGALSVSLSVSRVPLAMRFSVSGMDEVDPMLVLPGVETGTGCGALPVVSKAFVDATGIAWPTVGTVPVGGSC